MPTTSDREHALAQASGRNRAPTQFSRPEIVETQARRFRIKPRSLSMLSEAR